MLHSIMPEWFTQLGIIGWPLAACAVLLFAIFFERIVFLLRAFKRKDALYHELSDVLTNHKSAAKSVRDDLISLRLQELHPVYYSGIKPLKIIGSISPILGLLGTVLGIIKAFQVIAVQTGAVSPNMIADGLWEAMLTTAVGLSIALPALILAHTFRHYADVLLDSICLSLNKLSLSFDLEQSGTIHRQAA